MTRLTEARIAVGGLSRPSKMPGMAYSIPAKECKVGSTLAKIPGTVCYNCYALKGRYTFPIVQKAMYRRLDTIYNADWVNNMVIAINGQEYFRWHDSGDIQSVEHLRQICRVCAKTPETKHWLPTREHRMVKEYLAQYEELPKNLALRLSATKVGAKPPSFPGLTSTVHLSDKSKIYGHHCPAPAQGGKCAECRACWSPDVPNVSYGKH